MPYAPGIQSLPLGGQQLTTGQSLGQGYANAGASLAQGLGEWFKNDQQNNRMKAQTMGIIAQDPSILQQFTNPDQQKALTKVRDGSATAKDIWMAYGSVTAAKEAKTQQLQNQFIQAQIALQQQQQQAQARAMAQQQQAQDNIALGVRATETPYILNNGAYAKGKAIASDPMFSMAASAQRFNLPMDVAERFATNRYINGMALPPQTVDYVDPKTGLPSKVQIDPRTRQPVAVTINGQTVQSGSPQVPAGVLLPDQSADAEYKKAMATSAAKRYDTVIGSVNGYQNTIDTVDQTIPLIQSGDVKTGPLQDSFNTIKKGLNDALGLGFDVGKQDFAARSMADFAVSAAQRLNGQGQISDGERHLIATTVAQYKNSPQGNIIGMQWMKALAQREIDRAAYYRDVQQKNGRISGSEDLAFNKSHPIQAYFSMAGSPQSASALPPGWSVVEPK